MPPQPFQPYPYAQPPYAERPLPNPPPQYPAYPPQYAAPQQYGQQQYHRPAPVNAVLQAPLYDFVGAANAPIDVNSVLNELHVLRGLMQRQVLHTGELQRQVNDLSRVHVELQETREMRDETQRQNLHLQAEVVGVKRTAKQWEDWGKAQVARKDARIAELEEEVEKKEEEVQRKEDLLQEREAQLEGKKEELEEQRKASEELAARCQKLEEESVSKGREAAVEEGSTNGGVRCRDHQPAGEEVASAGSKRAREEDGEEGSGTDESQAKRMKVEHAQPDQPVPQSKPGPEPDSAPEEAPEPVVPNLRKRKREEEEGEEEGDEEVVEVDRFGRRVKRSRVGEPSHPAVETPKVEAPVKAVGFHYPSWPLDVMPACLVFGGGGEDGDGDGDEDGALA